MENLRCSSCKKSIVNESGRVKFLCPKCGKTEIIRCVHCRKTVVIYTCAECGFQGPN